MILIDPKFAEATRATICSSRLTANEVMCQAWMRGEMGDEYRATRDSKLAISEYTAVLQITGASKFDDHELDQILTHGLCEGLPASTARDLLAGSMKRQIASTYLAWGKRRLARVHVERICRPLSTRDDRNNKRKFPLKVMSNSVEGTVCSTAGYSVGD